MSATSPSESSIPGKGVIAHESTNSSAEDPAVGMMPSGPIQGAIRPPGSKSLTNRALVIAAMADGTSHLRGVLHSEDTEVMVESLSKIGIIIGRGSDHDSLIVDSTRRCRCPTGDPTGDADQRPVKAKRSSGESVEMFIANSGTSIRFLTAMLSVIGGQYRLFGIDRMHHRPIGDLTTAIEGVIRGTIEAQSPGGCPPVQIDSRGWNSKPISVAGNVSSQYLSGLLMAAGFSDANASSDGEPPESAPRIIRIEGALVSRPYVEMTLSMMADFGIQVIDNGDEFIVLPSEDGGGYRATDYSIEPDASAASYFWAAAAITGGSVTVNGLTLDALQGDVQVVQVLEKMGCRVDHGRDSITVTGGHLRGVDVDMNSISDTVQTIAPVALFADGPTRIRGVAHNRFKETDRIGDLAREIRRLGAECEEHEDGLTIHPFTPNSDPLPVRIQTYNDHRMAMGMSLVGLRRPHVWITNPACTTKTYPHYFADLQQLAGCDWRWC